MFLERLEISGFKSFAQKTTLEFQPPACGHFSVTGVVGPNGSGKSNVADSIRWVLGEQSMKLLRGKKSEDVIFSGSGSAARKSIAEVGITFNNEDRTLEDFGTHIEVARRLYRTGESEYLINKSTVRLADLELLLARAQVGHQSYSVIGQGLVDQVVVASPGERKQFFDEATGVREFQLKRERTVQKLLRVRENLREADLTVREIEPRLKSLERQVTRLSEKQQVLRELEIVRKQFYGKRMFEFASEQSRISEQLKALTRAEESTQRAHSELLGKMRTLEQTEENAPVLEDVQKEYEDLLQQRQEINEKLLKLQSALAVAAARSSRVTHTMVEADTLLDEIEALNNEHRALVKSIEQKDEGAIERALSRVGASIKNLLQKLAKYRTEKKPEDAEDGAHKEMEDLRIELVAVDMRIKEVRESIYAGTREAAKTKSSFFDLQRELQEKQQAMHQAERALHEAYIVHTRVQTHIESLEAEIKGEAPELLEVVRLITREEVEGVEAHTLQPRMLELRRRVEMIESIDPAVQSEHKELNERFTFLSGQVQDLTASLADLESVVAELDRRITHQRTSAFEALNREFQHFFSILFSGGKAALVQIPVAVAEVPGLDEEEGGGYDAADVPKDAIAGIDIQATPPGKRIQTIHTLSGGERAMTAIALLCAIVTINPSPFVVLDEVDAALDESNSARFADIVRELSAKVQFIVITHNRNTMHAANALYGVTMGEDGISHLVSITLDEKAEERASI